MKKNQSIKENQRKIVFENHRKSLIQHCERSELRLLKFIKNAKNGLFLRVFEKLKIAVKQYYQTGQF